MPAKSGAAYLKTIGNDTRPKRVRSQQLNHLPPSWVSERRECRINLIHASVDHQ